MDSGCVSQIRPYTEIGNNFFNGLCGLSFAPCVPVLRFCYQCYKIHHDESIGWECEEELKGRRLLEFSWACLPLYLFLSPGKLSTTCSFSYSAHLRVSALSLLPLGSLLCPLPTPSINLTVIMALQYLLLNCGIYHI